MADSDKIITVTPNTSVATTHPEIKFVGKDNSPMYLKVLDDNTLSFEGTEGQVFAISPTMSSGDIFSVNDISGVQSIAVNADGTITMDAQTKSTTIKNNASNTSTLILENTNADAIDGPMLEFYRNTPSPADGDDTGAIVWSMQTDAGNKHEFGRIVMEYSDASDGDERGELLFKLTEDSANEQEFMRLRGGSRQIELNTSLDDIDLCYNSDATSDFFYINAATQRIGIGDAGTAPSYLMHLEGVDGGNGELFVERTSGAGIHLQAQASYGIIGTTTNHPLGLKSNGSVRLYVEASGPVRIMPEDASSGTLKLSGAATGSAEGGEIQIETAADHDGTYNFYRIDAYEDDFRIGRQGETDFKLDQAGNITTGGIVDVPNLKINGQQGSDGQVLTSTGSGVAWEAASGGGAVDSIANFSNNRVLTASDADSINGEANLTFDGSSLTVTGQLKSHRLEVLTASSGLILTEAQSGAKVIWTGGTVTLPADPPVGSHYQVFNLTNSDMAITYGVGDGSHDDLGSGSVPDVKRQGSLNFIYVGSNDWIYTK
tara:strand:+ start:354 stop:1988 length:1635 start_codon:yes stop_codon:yes gene_type:complete